MILRRNHRTNRLAVGKRKDGNLLARHEFLDDDAAARRAERFALHDLVDGGKRFLLGHGDDDALARRESVRLDDDGRTLGFDVGARGGSIGKHLILRRRDAVLLHEVFGKCLRTLNIRRELRGAECLDSLRRQCVDNAARKRRLRADDDEIDAVLLGKSDDCRIVRRRDLRYAFGDCCHARIAWNRIEFFRLRTILELPCERMFTPAAADDQNSHLVAPISQSAPKDMRRCVRRRPTYDGTPHARVPFASCRARSRPFGSFPLPHRSARDSSRRQRT